MAPTIAEAGLMPSTTASPPLARKISLVCGPLHSRLNNAIIASLPLALPPKAEDTRAYAAGLASFGMIYTTYEDLWHSVAHPSHNQDASSSDSHDAKVASFFATLRPSGIERSPRLRKDLAYLQTTDEAPDAASRPQGSRMSNDDKAARRRFRKHIEHSLATKPHTLYAYAWCMYMAIFAGGRYIREDFATAGEKFWQNHGRPPSDSDSDSDSDSGPDTDTTNTTQSIPSSPPSYHSSTVPLLQASQTLHTNLTHQTTKKKVKPAPLDRPGYSFLSFGTSDDGASIRDTFISNLHAAETLFTSSEKDDIVAESRRIFELTIDLVAEMARTIKPSLEPERPHAWTPGTSNAPPRLPPPPPYTSYPFADDTALNTSGSNDKYEADPLLTQRASTPELLEWSRGVDPPRHGFVFWSKMVLLVLASMLVCWGLLFGVRLWLWHLGGVGGWDDPRGLVDGHAGDGASAGGKESGWWWGRMWTRRSGCGS